MPDFSVSDLRRRPLSPTSLPRPIFPNHEYCACHHAVCLRAVLVGLPCRKLVMSADWARVQWSSLSESNVSLTDTPRTHKEEMQMHKHIIEALASSTAAVSSQRRRMGFTKGDR